MRTENIDHVDEQTEPADDDLEQFTSYEDGDHHVICDTQNPKAWVRSDATRPLEP